MPVSEELVALAQQHRLVVSIEDNLRVGGLGERLRSSLLDDGTDTPVITFGVPQRFLEHGSRDEVLTELGLTGRDVARQVLEHLVQDRSFSAEEQPAQQR